MGCCCSSDQEEVEEIKNLLDEVRAENKRLKESINKGNNDVDDTEKSAKIENYLKKITQQLNPILSETLSRLHKNNMQDNISEGDEELCVSKECEELFLKNKEYHKETRGTYIDLECKLKNVTIKLMEINRIIERIHKNNKMKEMQEISCSDENFNCVAKKSKLHKLNEDDNECEELQNICNDKNELTDKTELTHTESKNVVNFIKQICDKVHKLHDYVNSKGETQLESILNEEFQQYREKVLQVFAGVEHEIQQYESEILTFEGSKSDKTSLHIQEMLHRQTAKLDKLQNLRNDEKLKRQRKNIIKKIWDLESELSSRCK